MMRKTLLALTALAGLAGAGVLTSASAAPAPFQPIVQPIQYYYGAGYDPRAAEWREREWRHEEWRRHHRWEEEHRWHEEHRGW
jgi:hypothetical protein